MADGPASNAVTFPLINTAQVITLGTILPLVCINVVALRFYSRRRKKLIGWDDWLILPGLFLYICMCICMTIGATNNKIGIITPNEEDIHIPPASYLIPSDPLFAKLLFAFQLMLTVGYGFIKCSIVALYQRIFVPSRYCTFDIVCMVTHGIIIAWSATFFILTVLGCGTDPSLFWGTTKQQATSCQTSFAAGQGLAGSDLILDLALMVLPQPLIWRLKLTVWRKILVSGVIVLGCSCVGASIARIVLFAQIDRAASLQAPIDHNQIVTLSIYYGALDGGLAIVAACLPTLRSMFKDVTVHGVVQGFKRFSFASSSAATSSRTSQQWFKNRASFRPMDVEKGMKAAQVRVRSMREEDESMGPQTPTRSFTYVPLSPAR